MEIGKLGVWYFFERLPAPAAAEAAQRIEQLGYRTLWIPETTGRHPFAHASWLLANTSNLVIATGIANIYEVSTHLRGEAGGRQVEGARIGLTHVIGLGSACGIHILEKA